MQKKIKFPELLFFTKADKAEDPKKKVRFLQYALEKVKAHTKIRITEKGYTSSINGVDICINFTYEEMKDVVEDIILDKYSYID